MKKISEIMALYIIRAGSVSPESFAVYQYGFQIGLEMLVTFTICCIIAILLQMVLEFIVFTGIFIFLRTYAGGVHLNKFISCLTCSVFVQTVVLVSSDYIRLSLPVSWSIIILCIVGILKVSPVECINRELSICEKRYFRTVTKKILIAIILFAAINTLLDVNKIVRLIALVLSVVMISQFLGVIKYKNEKRK